ncbi:MAG: SDR family NAD(P)-dependent oxidoreductase [Steroidobacteraceae bacterium]|jgi:NAD(P)-dependent dehydrogenase (short-subunit alcohol dehydrogenase family)|nr:SDR family NAD(P)-dependent oxidoreductase [Steroidobacteraceae bacterium]
MSACATPTFPDLRGKAVLVTGGARGLGRIAANHYAAQGMRVALAGRDASSLEAARAELAALGTDCHAVVLDVTNAASVEAGVAEVERWSGGLDVLLNNAGRAVVKPALEQDEGDWNAVLDTNLKGCWLVARRVALGMRDAGRGGSVVNVASIVGLQPVGQLAPYAASKAGLLHLTRQLAMEWARHRIRVNAIAPGYFETDMNRGFFDTEAGRAVLNRMPQRRLGTAADLAGPLLLLASEASAFMTGAVLAVDGGHSCASL